MKKAIRFTVVAGIYGRITYKFKRKLPMKKPEQKQLQIGNNFNSLPRE